MEEPSDAEVDAVIEEFEGNGREAVRALLHDIAVLAEDFSRIVSRGYVRGRTLPVLRLAARGQRDKVGEGSDR